MRTIRIIRFGKASRLLVGGLLLSLSFASCSNETDEQRLSGPLIGFNISTMQVAEDFLPASSKASATKSGTSSGSEPYLFILEGTTTAEGKSLYLHAISTDSIATTDSTEGDEEGAHTKAAPVTTTTMHTNAGVFASIYPASNAWNGTVPPNYIYDAEVKSSENWTTTYNWPGGTYKVGFFAYAPYRSTGVSVSSNTAPGAPVLTYDVPTAVTAQPDLLTAQAVDVAGNRNSAVPLTFRHVLTAVRFETGSHLLPGTITKITLKGVYGTASHRIGETAWNGHSNARNYEQTMTVSTPDPETPGTPITSPPVTFMMIPQTLPAGAQIEVTYTDNLTNTQRVLRADIASSVWTMGKTVTYRISTGSITVTPTLVVTPPAEFTYQGGSNTYTVKSYLEVVRPGDAPVTMPVAWTTEYSTDGGLNWSSTKPEWLTAFTESGTGGTTASTYTATVQAQTGTMTNHTEVLQNATPKTNWNLSNATGGDAVENTANCYLVNAPGTYRLPLVYGNAVKNGVANTTAYTSSVYGGDSEHLGTFHNHKGVAITDPYIYNNADCTPFRCALVWQDEPNLVTNVQLSADSHYLEFTVNQATIRQGNAVVEVCGASNKTMWSWHIWVTDYVLGTNLKTIVNAQNLETTILPINLGWCDDGLSESYAERTIQVRFIQHGTNNYTPATTQTFTLKQNAHNSNLKGNNPYYQWGRKDPFVGDSGQNDGTNKTWYNASGTPQINQLPPRALFPQNNANSTLIYGIQSPAVYNIENQSRFYHNLWNTNANSITNPVIKTIYDPSPAGYKVPFGHSFTGFALGGYNAPTASQINADGPFNNGWNFYCKTGLITVFFPASKIRASNNGSLSGTLGAYWTAQSVSGYKRGYMLYFTNATLYPMYPQSHCAGVPIRPCQEE